MRIEALIVECDNQLKELYKELEKTMHCAINGQYKPKVAIMLYKKMMQRVTVLNHRSWRLTNEERDYDRNYSILNFKDFIQFFEL